MSPARAAILALVCGLPSRERHTRQILMLEAYEAYSDGSTTDGELLVLAGYVANVDTWLPFSDAWQASLDQRDGGRAFKMSRAAKTADGRRLAHAQYKLIEEFNLLGVGCAVPIKPLVAAVAAEKVDPKLANPYYIAWRLLITATLQALEHAKINASVEFVFDEQTEQVTIHNAWRLFHANAPARYRRRIKNNISFKDDEDVRPLQAADLLAWHARKQYGRDPRDMGALFPLEWTKEPKVFFVHLTADGIDRLIAGEVENAAKRGRTIARDAFKFENVPYLGWAA